MNKDDITINPMISLDDKTILRGILGRHNTEELCPICSEIIDSLMFKELNMDVHSLSEINNNINNLSVDIDSLEHRINNINFTSDAVEDIKIIYKKLNHLETNFNYLNEIKNTINTTLEHNKLVLTSITEQITTIIEYLNIKKTINLRDTTPNKLNTLTEKLIITTEEII